MSADQLLTALFNAGIAISVGATVMSLGMSYIVRTLLALVLLPLVVGLFIRGRYAEHAPGWQVNLVKAANLALVLALAAGIASTAVSDRRCRRSRRSWLGGRGSNWLLPVFTADTTRARQVCCRRRGAATPAVRWQSVRPPGRAR
jgi:hypothetical protein